MLMDFVGVIQLLIVFFVGGQLYMDYLHESEIPKKMILCWTVNVRVLGRRVLAMAIDGNPAREIDDEFEERSERKRFVVMVLWVSFSELFEKGNSSRRNSLVELNLVFQIPCRRLFVLISGVFYGVVGTVVRVSDVMARLLGDEVEMSVLREIL
jgi:hypothetical protein